MNYEIQNKSDFITGTYLITNVPENELDQRALQTIQTDCPDFILPFHYKSSNGMIELAYKVGTKSKLQYFSGSLTPCEYSDLWQSLLKPLIDCGDWFMNPCSFILNADYLYYDKSKKTVSYVYIPSINGCSGYEAFYEMAVKVSKMMKVSDVALENKVLKSIIENFNPAQFLKMIKDHISENTEPLETMNHVDKHEAEISTEPTESSSGMVADQSLNASKTLRPIQAQNPESDAEDDILIDFQSEKKAEQKKKERDTGGYRMFSGRSKKKKTPQQSMSKKPASKVEPKQKNVMRQTETSTPKSASKSTPETGQTHTVPPIIVKQTETIDITQSTPIMADGPGLRYVGRAQLPPSIQIMISEGEIFTIGRFDANVGKQQSSFEFDKKTKAVSRRHAVIERDVEGYKIIDLASSAGTFVNDKKLPPNTPHGLERGYRVSFGNFGADYVWEVS